MAQEISEINHRNQQQIKMKKSRKVKGQRHKSNKKSLTCLNKWNDLNLNIIKSYLETSKGKMGIPKEISIHKLFKSVKNQL